MRKQKFIVVLIALILLVGCVSNKYEISKKDMLEEYGIFWSILEENFIYQEILETRSFQKDVLKEEFREKVKNAASFDEYVEILEKLINIEFLGEGHLMLLTAEEYFSIIKTMENIFIDPNNGDFRQKSISNDQLNFIEYNNPEKIFAPYFDIETKQRYQMIINKSKEYNKNIEVDNQKSNGKKGYSVNLHSDYKNRILFIEYQSFSFEYVDENRKIIERALSEFPYDIVTIDIRNNSGGTSLAWKDIVAILSESSIDYTEYYLLKGSLSRKYMSYVINENNIEVRPIKENRYIYIINKNINTTNILTTFPSVYILSNKNCYSAADEFLRFSKQNNFATIIGENAGEVGSGIGDPLTYVLPKSKLLIRFSVTAQCDENGELLDTIIEPDILVNPNLHYFEYLDIIKKDYDKRINIKKKNPRFSTSS